MIWLRLLGVMELLLRLLFMCIEKGKDKVEKVKAKVKENYESKKNRSDDDIANDILDKLNKLE